MSKAGIALLGYGYGVLGWEREGSEHSNADGKEEDCHDDFYRFL